MAALSMGEQLRDQSGSYLPRLVAIFYAVFDEKQGPKIVSQVPEGSIATALSTFPDTAQAPESPSRVEHTGAGIVRSTSQQPGTSNTRVLFDFSSILDFVIPKPELCGHLITKATRTSKILGFPVRIYNEEKYHKGKENHNRNAFLFNLCFVFERDAELSCFEPIVRKAGRSLRMAEESESLLSSPPSTFDIANLLEQIFMDINTFSETSIALYDTHLDLFLLPFYANPPEIRLWDVPIAVTGLEEMKNASWDVTLFKVCTFIDGVNHVKRIAELAEVDQELARLCIKHLLFYSAIILVDLFQFSNSYATLSSITNIVQHGDEEDEGVTDLREECEAYVYCGNGDISPVPFATLLTLYASLAPGLSVGSWMDIHNIDSLPIDVRRMIQFGVIKGFLRRVLSYPVWLDHPALNHNPNNVDGKRREKLPANATSSSSRPSYSRDASSSIFSAWGSSNLSSPGLPSDAPAVPQERTALVGAQLAREDPELIIPTPLSYPKGLPMMLTGKHHTDEICVKFGMSFRKLEGYLKSIGGKDEENTAAGGVGDDGAGRRGSEGKVGQYGSRVVMLYI